MQDLDVLFRTGLIDATGLNFEQTLDLMRQRAIEHVADVAREYEVSEDEAYRLIAIYRSLGRRFSRSATAHLREQK